MAFKSYVQFVIKLISRVLISPKINKKTIAFDDLVDIGIVKKGIDLSSCNLREK